MRLVPVDWPNHCPRRRTHPSATLFPLNGAADEIAVAVRTGITARSTKKLSHRQQANHLCKHLSTNRMSHCPDPHGKVPVKQVVARIQYRSCNELSTGAARSRYDNCRPALHFSSFFRSICVRPMPTSCVGRVVKSGANGSQVNCFNL